MSIHYSLPFAFLEESHQEIISAAGGLESQLDGFLVYVAACFRGFCDKLEERFCESAVTVKERVACSAVVELDLAQLQKIFNRTFSD